MYLICGLFPSACARDQGLEPGSLEIRLTRTESLEFLPRFSPDGQQVAFSSESPSKQGEIGIGVIPARGGATRMISPEGVSEVGVGWGPSGTSLFVMSFTDMVLRRMDLDGKVLESYATEPGARIVSVSRDGSRFLFRKFTGDNYDLALLEVGGPEGMTLVASTPEWEFGGCFGPGPEDLTAVQQKSIGSSESELRVWSGASGAYVSLSVPRARNTDPCWSHDGRFLAYATNRSGSGDIWILDPATGRNVQITSTPHDDHHPDWSPDDTWLVFSRWTETSHIFVANASNGENRQLTRGPDYDFSPEISPDGLWVAFLRRVTREDSPTGYALCLASTADGRVRELDLAGLTVAPRAGLCWSPDGSQIAFGVDDGGGNIHLYRIHRDAGERVRVTLEAGQDLFPDWSPDGQMIGYTHLAGGETQIWAIPATGGRARKLTWGEGVSQVAVWSPDSERLMYLSAFPDGTSMLRVCARMGGEDREILRTDGYVYPMAWSRTGQQVLYRNVEEKEYTVWAVSLDGREKIKVGTGSTPDWPAGLELTPEGISYLESIYPSGRLVHDDGERVSDLYAVQVSNRLQNELLTRRE